MCMHTLSHLRSAMLSHLRDLPDLVADVVCGSKDRDLNQIQPHRVSCIWSIAAEGLSFYTVLLATLLSSVALLLWMHQQSQFNRVYQQQHQPQQQSSERCWVSDSLAAAYNARNTNRVGCTRDCGGNHDACCPVSSRQSGTRAPIVCSVKRGLGFEPLAPISLNRSRANASKL